MSVSEVLNPTPRRPLKRRFLEDLDPELEEPAPKRRREECPVLDWLSYVPAPSPKALPEISRPQSLPAKLNDNQDLPTKEDLRGYPKSTPAIDEMGDRRGSDRRDRGDDGSFSQRTARTTVSKVKSSDPQYRSTLQYNNVKNDLTGLKVSPAVRTLMDTNILKTRTSPPLSDDRLIHTMTSINKWGSSTENVVNSFISSDMFPVHQEGIGLGGNSQWPRAALSYNPDYGYPISTPKPDYHVGYAIGPESGFSAQQAHVIDHKQAKPYTQPGTGNVLPFLTVELKSEATGGTLFHAENQAAGSGTYSLRSMEWLLDKAKASQANRETDTIAFSISGTGRLVVLSVHWHSLEDRTYYMSYVKGFLTSEKEHVQACHNTVKNIIDWAIKKRHPRLKAVLQELFPLSHQWTDKRTATAGELDDPGDGEAAEEDGDDDDDGDDEEEEIEALPRRAAKGRRSEPTKGNRRSSAATQSFASTQPVGDRRSATTRDTSVTKGSKQGSKQGSERR
jgi:hypothetical protein